MNTLGLWTGFDIQDLTNGQPWVKKQQQQKNGSELAVCMC